MIVYILYESGIARGLYYSKSKCEIALKKELENESKYVYTHSYWYMQKENMTQEEINKFEENFK